MHCLFEKSSDMVLDSKPHDSCHMNLGQISLIGKRIWIVRRPYTRCENSTQQYCMILYQIDTKQNLLYSTNHEISFPPQPLLTEEPWWLYKKKTAHCLIVQYCILYHTDCCVDRPESPTWRNQGKPATHNAISYTVLYSTVQYGKKRTGNNQKRLLLNLVCE